MLPVYNNIGVVPIIKPFLLLNKVLKKQKNNPELQNSTDNKKLKSRHNQNLDFP